MKTPTLRLLAAYTGTTSIRDALVDARAARLLWLEILVNDHLDPEPWKEEPAFEAAYRKACLWYTTYRRRLDAVLPRRPLPPTTGVIDRREMRTFLEPMRLAASHACSALLGQSAGVLYIGCI